jgi:hypothetical protein
VHLQDGTQGWLNALKLMPDGALVKSVNDPSKLREAKLAWSAAGRDPKKLLTDFRFHDLYPPNGSFQEARNQWRAQFFKFVDRTFLEQYAPYIDLVEEGNEYTASSTWTDATDTLRVVNSMLAAVDVWNTEFRGRWVNSPDGGHGFISGDCKLVLCNGPVGNDLHPRVYEISVMEDAPIGYHPYTRWQNRQRFVNDFQDDSGRWVGMENRWGYKPEYVWTECGPYISAANGWRHPDVIGGDVSLLAQAMRLWVKDMQTTAAYHEGRILGTGAWFTSGGGETWQWYEMNEEALTAVANVFREEWRPGPAIGDTSMTQDDLQVIRANAQAIVDVCNKYLPAPVPQPLKRVKIIVSVLNIRNGPGASFVDIGDARLGEIYSVWEERNGWFRVHQTEQRWISGADAYTDPV